MPQDSGGLSACVDADELGGRCGSLFVCGLRRSSACSGRASAMSTPSIVVVAAICPVMPRSEAVASQATSKPEAKSGEMKEETRALPDTLWAGG